VLVWGSFVCKNLSSVPLCVGSLALPAVFRRGKGDMRVAQTLRLSGFHACPPRPLAFKALFTQNVYFFSGGSNTCSPDHGFYRADCVSDTLGGKRTLVCVFGDIFRFRPSRNTTEHERESHLGSLVGLFGMHFCYRTRKICTKTEMWIFCVFCSKSRALEACFSYKTRRRITFLDIWRFCVFCRKNWSKCASRCGFATFFSKG
jgi:hypothetical protein